MNNLLARAAQKGSEMAKGIIGKMQRPSVSFESTLTPIQHLRNEAFVFMGTEVDESQKLSAHEVLRRISLCMVPGSSDTDAQAILDYRRSLSRITPGEALKMVNGLKQLINSNHETTQSKTA